MEKLKNDYWRQLDFYKPDMDNNHVLVVGAGSIGSYTVYGLARMGVKNITVIDFDMVEPHNLPNQFFAESIAVKDILKTGLLKATIDFMIPDNKVNYISSKVEIAEQLKLRSWDVIIMAVDSMSVRKWIWENLGTRFIIDCRIGGEFVNVFCVYKGFIKEANAYIKQLWTDEEVNRQHELPCTGTAVIDVCFTAVGEIIQRYRKIVAKQPYPMWTFHDCKMGGTGYIMQTFNTNYDQLTVVEAVQLSAERLPLEEPSATIIDEELNLEDEVDR